MLRITLLFSFFFSGFLSLNFAQSTNIQEILDIPYYQGKQAHPEKHKLDLYLPKALLEKKPSKKVPVILFVHGGAWFFGSRKLPGIDAFDADIGRFIARYGMIAALISYRLGPHDKHPAQMIDIARAFHFLIEEIASYGGDPQRIFLMGYSAGGHLISLFALEEQWIQSTGNSLSQIKGVFSISGLYDLNKAKGVAQYTFENQISQASPITHTKKTTFPIVLILAEKDPQLLLESGQEFALALKTQQTSTLLYTIPKRNHFTLMSSFGQKDDPTSFYFLQFITKNCLDLEIQTLLEKELRSQKKLLPNPH